MADTNVEVSADGRSSTYNYGATGTAPSAAALVDRALERMSKELDPYDAARNLLTRWVEHDSTLRHLLTDALNDLEAREKRQMKRRTKQQASAVKVGDIALVATTIGPTFYRVRKVISDEAGNVKALALSDPNSTNTGQPVAIDRITAVFSNVLNPKE
jgi:hypothetical protein